ncbi:hypothetical protein HPB48_008680 [Haemaphysalis longicornis]|uniref:Uncharacterized protein n=1 Tax=Haemaphysalis longicornis TaxID=44386 RepID=A0A9J6G7D1_HAELO|nr:hypothetical protein HPB48_008680 [Haemaphysalis longicornis]
MLPATGAAVCLPPPTTLLGQPSGDPPGPATEPGIIAASIAAASSGPPAASSPCSSDPGPSRTSLPPGQVSPPVVPSEQPLPDDMDDFSDITDSTSGTIISGTIMKSPSRFSPLYLRSATMPLNVPIGLLTASRATMAHMLWTCAVTPDPTDVLPPHLARAVGNEDLDSQGGAVQFAMEALQRQQS